ncbi:hypothetical protein EV702DRAFT_1193419 [Suillus placidus]|uniref:Uncharacterized protein n=1 Tax=Suillus placidus TaxID=48579 RepID=A0A9P7A2J8_9AGAM|nr:hypothetical protein EV702DRAFT_1193419 [Suillus placidus]
MSESLIVEEVMQGALSGTLATMLLYGVTCMQTFHYWQTYEHDRKFLKSMVVFIWLLETAHTALSVHFVEYYLIIHFGEFTHLGYAVWSMGATCIIGAAAATVRCGFGFANCVLSFIYPMWTDFRTRVFATMVAGQILSAVVDGVIAFTLCFYLRKRRTGMKRQDIIYATSLLASLNARKRTREKIEQAVPTADCIALSLFRTAQPDSSFLQGIGVEKSVTMGICNDSLDTGMDGHATA